MPSVKPPSLAGTVLAVLLCVPAAAPVLAADSQPQPSSGAGPDLVCNPSDPTDCYPRVFQPTYDFQVVREGQEIPGGLHVRLNIWSGHKEAKINVPDQQDPAVDGLPVDQAVVVVDPQQQPSPPRIPAGAPRYDPVGKVKEPQVVSGSFVAAMEMLRGAGASRDAAFDEALDGLEELSHDIYYGLKIAEDTDVLKSLFCLMAGHEAAASDDFHPRDQQAASILAGALQNNPAALDPVAKVWPQLMGYKCPDTGTRLRESLYASLTPASNVDAAGARDSASRIKAKVSTIDGLVKDGSIRSDFLQRDGMQRLLAVLVAQGQEWAAAQRKVGQLVLDNFLDEDMGAALGQWPTAPRLSDAQCRSDDPTAAGCWDYHVARIMRANSGDKGHWSRDLSQRLAAARKSADENPVHQDL